MYTPIRTGHQPDTVHKCQIPQRSLVRLVRILARRPRSTVTGRSQGPQLDRLVVTGAEERVLVVQCEYLLHWTRMTGERLQFHMLEVEMGLLRVSS